MISPRDLALGRTWLGEGYADRSGLYWTASRPQDDGRTSLWRWDGAQGVDVTGHWDVRTSIHGYGGTPVAVKDGAIVFFDRTSSQVWAMDPHGTAAAITPQGTWRWGGFSFVDDHTVVCVREDCDLELSEPRDALVLLDLKSDNAAGGTVIAQGASFYHSPAVCADGSIAWMEWDHPHMPWDESRLIVRDPEGRIHPLVDRPDVSAVYPQWDRDGSLVFLTDESGYWTFSRWRDQNVTRINDQAYDFCAPPWVLSQPPYALLDDGSIACSWLEDSLAHIGLLHPDGSLADIMTLASATLGPCDDEGVSIADLGFPDRACGLYAVSWPQGTLTHLVSESQVRIPLAELSVAREVTWAASDTGEDVHGWYYPTRSTTPAPLLVTSHGGPTGFSSSAFSLARQFFTQHGIAVLDVNYSGSSGYGKAYRDRLHGQWGVVDVRDCVEGALTLVDRGLADPHRLAIMGGSAGGYTTLVALTTSTTFTAGISLYGIGDLVAMFADTHKFEAHYNDWLIGPYPERADLYAERSPMNHLDALSCPMLILQGAEDTVVPPNQATTMYEAVTAKGLEAELVIYPGEGHGFRDPATIEDEYTRILSFLTRVFGL